LKKDKVTKQDLVDAIIVEFLHKIAIELGIPEFSFSTGELNDPDA
jgi:hypothetical protein